MAQNTENAAEYNMETANVDEPQADMPGKSYPYRGVISELRLCQRLGTAASLGDLDLVKTLLVLGAELNPTDQRAIEPLWYATANGHTHIVEYLLMSGAQIISYCGRNAFLPAIVSGKSELVSIFLRYGANPEAEIVGWLNPIMLARELGHFKIVELFEVYEAELPV